MPIPIIINIINFFYFLIGLASVCRINEKLVYEPYKFIINEKTKRRENPMPTYNKLIRNKIPQIIEANGKTPTTRILPEEEYIKELCKKTQEELTEYLEADTKKHKLEELSDLLELINVLAEHEDTTLEEINNIRKKKAEERGGFSDRVFLIEVTDN
ncbi:Phosphoribosyl-ATP pyrophosphohydrolase [Bacillus thuringiensis serovar huazhongensis BGSC 4BD1]|nr:Phosphoribosyl-ATP pyrophosphohydrolase [Bacillus thuringiensis serovar huazhongensis BGSC 4BD1]